MARSSYDEFVVSGAKVYCSGSIDKDGTNNERTVDFKCDKSSIIIAEGVAGLASDKTMSNFPDGFGKCRFVSGDCKEYFEPVSPWLNTAESTRFVDTTKLALAMEEYKNACKYATTVLANYIKICNDDFNNIGFFENVKELSTSIFGLLERLSESSAQKSIEDIKKSDKGFSQALKDLEEGNILSLAELQKILEIYRNYQPSAGKAEIPNVNLVIDKLESDRQVINDPEMASEFQKTVENRIAESERLYKDAIQACQNVKEKIDKLKIEQNGDALLIKKSALLCLNLGIIQFKTNGQAEALQVYELRKDNEIIEHLRKKVEIAVTKHFYLEDLSKIYSSEDFGSSFAKKIYQNLQNGNISLMDAISELKKMDTTYAKKTIASLRINETIDPNELICMLLMLDKNIIQENIQNELRAIKSDYILSITEVRSKQAKVLKKFSDLPLQYPIPPFPVSSAKDDPDYLAVVGHNHGGYDFKTLQKGGFPVRSTCAGWVETVVTGRVQKWGASGDESYGNYVKIKGIEREVSEMDRADSIIADNKLISEDMTTINYLYVYAHLEGENNIRSVGDFVLPGEWIGKVGTTGNSSGYHLHYDVRIYGTKADKRLDPKRFIGEWSEYNVIP